MDTDIYFIWSLCIIENKRIIHKVVFVSTSITLKTHSESHVPPNADCKTLTSLPETRLENTGPVSLTLRELFCRFLKNLQTVTITVKYSYVSLVANISSTLLLIMCWTKSALLNQLRLLHCEDSEKWVERAKVSDRKLAAVLVPVVVKEGDIFVWLTHR